MDCDGRGNAQERIKAKCISSAIASFLGCAKNE
jgi:hypothetical protein